jgi:hypothetical protein
MGMWETVVNVFQAVTIGKTVKDWVFPAGTTAQTSPQQQQQQQQQPQKLRSSFDVNRYTYVDAQGFRAFYPQHQMEFARKLRLYRVTPIDMTDHSVSLTFDPTVPYESSAERWACIRNADCAILAISYMMAPEAAAQRTFLRAVKPSQKRMFATGESPPYAVLFDVGKAESLGIRLPVIQPPVPAKVDPKVIVPTVVPPWAPQVAAPEAPPIPQSTMPASEPATDVVTKVVGGPTMGTAAPAPVSVKPIVVPVHDPMPANVVPIAGPATKKAASRTRSRATSVTKKKATPKGVATKKTEKADHKGVKAPEEPSTATAE